MTTQKNGVTIPTNGKKEEPGLSVVPKVPSVIKVGDNAPPLEDRLLRLNQLFELQTRYNRLLKSQTKLSDFKMKKGEENISITIRDAHSREEFETKNPELIGSVLECVRITLIDKKNALEPLLKW